MATRKITAQETVRIEGLSQFVRDLRVANRDLPKAVREANLALANQVIGIAKGKASTRMERSAADTLYALASQREASVRLGSSKKPYSIGAEFGAIQYKQFRAWKGNQWTGWNNGDTGYFLHPAIKEAGEGPVFELYFQSLDKILLRAFTDPVGMATTPMAAIALPTAVPRT